MVVDVIDIRKRIEKIRNDVSEAIVSQHEFEAREEALREDITLSVSPAGTPAEVEDVPELPLRISRKQGPNQPAKTGQSEYCNPPGDDTNDVYALFHPECEKSPFKSFANIPICRATGNKSGADNDFAEQVMISALRAFFTQIFRELLPPSLAHNGPNMRFPQPKKPGWPAKDVTCFLPKMALLRLVFTPSIR